MSRLFCVRTLYGGLIQASLGRAVPSGGCCNLFQPATTGLQPRGGGSKPQPKDTTIAYNPSVPQGPHDLAEFGRLRNPLIADDADSTIVDVKSVLSFVQVLTLQEPKDGPVLTDDAATGLFHIVSVCNGALESLRVPSEAFLAAMAQKSEAETSHVAPVGARHDSSLADAQPSPGAPEAPHAAPGSANARVALLGDGSTYFRALLFAGDTMAAESCQLELANADDVRIRAEEAAWMLETHLNQVSRLLQDSQRPQPPRPSLELVDDLLWTTNELGGLLDALRALETITTEIQQGRRAAGGTR